MIQNRVSFNYDEVLYTAQHEMQCLSETISIWNKCLGGREEQETEGRLSTHLGLPMTTIHIQENVARDNKEGQRDGSVCMCACIYLHTVKEGGRERQTDGQRRKYGWTDGLKRHLEVYLVHVPH